MSKINPPGKLQNRVVLPIVIPSGLNIVRIAADRCRKIAIRRQSQMVRSTRKLP
jgi:hypothetical protein